MRDEVIGMEKAFEAIPAIKPNPQMTEIAEKIIAQQEGAFAPAEFRDRYEEALRELIARKEKGEKPKPIAPPPDTSNVIDLMEALKKSLGGKGAKSPPVTASARAKRPPRRAR
jgi:DNA end-binding protein Ku